MSTSSRSSASANLSKPKPSKGSTSTKQSEPSATATAIGGAHTTAPLLNPIATTSAPSKTTVTGNTTANTLATVTVTHLLTTTSPVPLPSTSLFAPHQPGISANNLGKTKRIPVWAIIVTSIVLSLLFIGVLFMLCYRCIHRFKGQLEDYYSREAWAQAKGAYLRELEPDLERIGKTPIPFPKLPFLSASRGPQGTGTGSSQTFSLGRLKGGHTTREEISNPLAFTQLQGAGSSGSSGGSRSMDPVDRAKRSNTVDSNGSQGSKLSKSSSKSGVGTQRGFILPAESG